MIFASAFTGMSFFLEMAMVIVAALAGSAVARSLGQPAILGYILGGICISPFTWGPSIADAHHFDEIAEFGVILLMFSIGTEFSLRDLGKVRRLALIGGPLAVLAIIGLGMLTALGVGWPLLRGAVLGAVIASASTMVLGRLLIDRGLLKSEVGKITIGLSIIDDLAVVILIVLLPVFGALTPESITGLGWELGKAFLILAPVLFLSHHGIPALLKKVSAWNNPEFLLLFAAALSIAAAAFTEWLGLSLALGAFLAGMLLSNSSEGHTVAARLEGLRDLCVAVFFVSVGALIDPGALLQAPKTILVLLGLVLVGKFLVWTAIIRAFGNDGKTSIQCAVFLSQIGEFAFVLAAVALGENLISHADYNAVLAVALLSILVNSLATKSKLFREQAIPR